MMHKLSFDNVSKSYSNEAFAIANVTFEVMGGEILGLIGPNGAGKSTVIKIAAKLLKQYSGIVALDEININEIDDEHYLVSYIPDIPVYFDFMTLGEHLDFVDDLYKKQGVMSKEQIISTLTLSSHLSKHPGSVSKGTLQKLMIALALLRPFDLLIADEPFSGLDPEHILTLRDIFLNVKKQGKGVLLSTHRLEIADSYCDRYVLLDSGKIAGYGKKEALAKLVNLDNNAPVTDIYLEITKGR